MRELRGLIELARLTFRRQFTGRRSVVAAILVTLLCLSTVLWSRRHAPAPDASAAARDEVTARLVRQVIMPAFLKLLLPILVLMPAVAAIGDERDEHTIVYLLVRPLARWRMYLAKGMGVLPLALGWGLGAFALVCLCAGSPGTTAWILFWPAIALACVTYGALFLLFGATVPRPLVVAVVYTFFVEALLGSMPGTIKRISISFHTQCLLYDVGKPIGLALRNSAEFLPISGPAATLVLGITSLTLLGLGALLFHRREFWD